MAKGRKTGGRKAGSRNKHTKTTLEQYASVFEGLGGVAAMLRWAKENQTEFYRIHARTLPLDVTSGNKPLETHQTIVIGGQAVQF